MASKSRPFHRLAARRTFAGQTILASALLPLAIAACGEGSASTGARRATATTSSGGGTATIGVSTTAGSMHATLIGQNHKPVTGHNWRYTVTARDAKGRPLSGTVETEFAFQGFVVGKETPPTHPLKNGAFKDVLQFPARAVGNPIALQVVVRTKLGSATLDWPITVQK